MGRHDCSSSPRDSYDDKEKMGPSHLGGFLCIASSLLNGGILLPNPCFIFKNAALRRRCPPIKLSSISVMSTVVVSMVKSNPNPQNWEFCHTSGSGLP